MNEWEVGELKPISMARYRTGKLPLKGKLVNVNKHDAGNPLIMSRYVACEVRTYKEDSLFASTPPLETLRLLLSWAVTGTGGAQNVKGPPPR